jgi:hypothetical protein
MKTCSRCSNAKPLSAFHKARAASGLRAPRGGCGVAAVCKVCTAEMRRPGIVAERERERVDRSALALKGRKRCTTCLLALPLGSFSKRKASQDGLSYKCFECYKKYLEKYRSDNPDGFKRWRENNLQREQERFRAYRAANSKKLAESMARWARNNSAKVNANIARRTAAKLMATPTWADPVAIASFYDEAARLTRETGIRHEVDHIYPLQGKSVCGLHVEHNLQVLTKFENIQKLNRTPEEHERRKRTTAATQKAA